MLGGAFVGIVLLLGRLHFATPIPFLLLSPGFLAGVCVPGSGFNLKEDTPLSPLALVVVFAVNTALYSGFAYLLYPRLVVSK